MAVDRDRDMDRSGISYTDDTGKEPLNPVETGSGPHGTKANGESESLTTITPGHGRHR